MKSPLGGLFLILIFIYSCSSDSKSSSTNISAEQQVKVLTKHFSDLVEQDTFKVTLTGSSPKDMKLSFSIKSHQGHEIYLKEFKAKELLDPYKGTVDLKKEASQISFIKAEFGRFLDEDNFLEPAVTPAEEAGKHVPDKAFFEDLKMTELNGFFYRTGQDSKVYIAWSEKDKKVKVYYKCC